MSSDPRYEADCASGRPCAHVVVDPSVPKGAGVPADIPRESGRIAGSPRLVLPVVYGKLGASGSIQQLDARPVAASPVAATTVFAGNNGLATAVRLAYNFHLPLRLRPDDLWLAVLASVGAHIDKNAERFRGDFVLHEGMLNLCVSAPPEWEAAGAPVDWNGVIRSISDMVRARTVPGVHATFDAAYSTSDAVSVTACRISLMAALKSYFSYGMRSHCGIREVYLEGSREDWVKLRADAAALNKLGVSELRHWLAALDGTLAQLVTTYEGAPDAEFWSHIYSAERKHGSGEQGTFITGWFLNFFLYNSEGTPLHHITRPLLTDALEKPWELTEAQVEALLTNPRLPRVKEQRLPLGYATVPFYWELRSGATRNFQLCSGSWAAALYEDGSVGPVIQWLVME